MNRVVSWKSTCAVLVTQLLLSGSSSQAGTPAPIVEVQPAVGPVAHQIMAGVQPGIARTVPIASATEPQLEGVPLSCRIFYAEFLQDKARRLARSTADSSDSLPSQTTFQLRYFSEQQKILQTYIAAKQYDAGLKFFEAGSTEWLELAKLAILQDPKTYSVKVFESTLATLPADQKHRILIELNITVKDASAAFAELQAIAPSSTQPVNWSYAQESRWNLSAFLVQQGQIEKAELLIKPALDHDYLNDHDRDIVLAQIVKVYAEAGLPDRALQLAERISDVKGRQSHSFNLIAQSYLRKGRTTEGLKILDRANVQIQRLITLVTKYHPATNVPRIDVQGLIIGYAQLKKYDVALEQANSSQPIYSPSTLIRLRLIIAKQAIENRDRSQGMSIVQQTAQAVDRIPDRVSMDKLSALIALAQTYQGIEQPQLAKKRLDQAFALSQQLLKPTEAAFFFDDIFMGYLAMKDYAQAVEVAKSVNSLQEYMNLFQIVQCYQNANGVLDIPSQTETRH